MTVNVSIQFSLETSAEAEKAVKAMKLPDGAFVQATETTPVIGGVIEKGKVVSHEEMAARSQRELEAALQAHLDAEQPEPEA